MERRTFIAVSATTLAALGAANARADAIPGGTHYVERHADFDESAFDRAVAKDANIRQMWEAVSFHPEMFGNIKNSLNGLQFGYGYRADRIAMVVCPHGPSAAFTYSDDVWQRYRIGELFGVKDPAGTPLVANAFFAPTKPVSASTDPDDVHGPFQDVSISGLQKRGVLFLTCHTAVEEQSRKIAAAGYAPAGATAADVADDILTHLIPGAIVVPSMVATVAVLQYRYHYAYTTLAF